MINILLISHGSFCAELKNTMQMVYGDHCGIKTVPLLPGEAPEAYRKKLKDTIDTVYNEAGILILADILGGTPFNSAVYLKKDYKIGLVTGMNVPMVLALVFGRKEESSLDELIALATKEESLGIKGQNLSKGGRKRHEKLSIDQD